MFYTLINWWYFHLAVLQFCNVGYAFLVWIYHRWTQICVRVMWAKAIQPIYYFVYVGVFGNCADPLALINVAHSQSNPVKENGIFSKPKKNYTRRSSSTLRAQDISRHAWWSSRKFRIFLSSVGLLNLRSLISRYRKFQSCKSTR